MNHAYDMQKGRVHIFLKTARTEVSTTSLSEALVP